MKKDRQEFVLVYDSGDVAMVDLVRSLLEDAGLRTLVKNDGVQNLFGLGSIGGVNPLIGTMKIFVNQEDAEKAQEVLAAVSGPDAEETQGESPSKETPEMLSADGAAGERGGFLSLLRRWIKG